MTEPLRWLIGYFEEHGQLGGKALEELLDQNFVSLELLDSLGVVQMLVGLEEEFGVWLDPEEMQDPRFCSIGGLAELVEESRAKAA
jgi:acyl carrier protein